MTHTPLFVFALSGEAAGQFSHLPLLFTGVGKVNAARALCTYLHTAPVKPSLIVNCGTAGARHLPAGAVYQCHDFIQHDMDVTPLGFAPYQTPFSNLPVPLAGGADMLPDLPVAVCGTGDHFVTKWPDGAPYALVDMEAYALAAVAQDAGVPFMALKYISDNADDASHTDWGAALERAARALRAAVDQHIARS